MISGTGSGQTKLKLAPKAPAAVWNIITYHHSNKTKEQWKLPSLIHSRRPSQEGLRECRTPSDLSGCYFILPPICGKAGYLR